MKIRKLKEIDLPELIKFGEEVFPDRKSYYSSLINFVLKNRIDGYTGGVGLFDGDKICGQSLFTQMTLWHRGIKEISGWGYELIVKEELRMDSWGLEVMMESRRIFPNTCATGSGPLALKLNLKLGNKLIGEIRKYVGLTSLSLSSILAILPKGKIPENVDGFRLIKFPEDFKTKNYFNFNLIEAGRDSDFIKWRYFTAGFKKYYVYQNDSGEYFVVRTIKQKGFRMLLLLDFRCDLSSEEPFRNILKAVKKIAIKVHDPFILCGSSHKIVDSILEEKHFKSIGRPRPIIVGKKFMEWIDKEKIENRDFALITLADSDGEWSW